MELEQWVGQYAALVRPGFREAAGIFAMFLVGGLAYYYLAARRRIGGGASVSSAFSFLFRADLYRHPSARSDRWNFTLSYLLWLPLMRVALTAVMTFASALAFYAFLSSVFGVRTPIIVGPSMVLGFQFTCIFLCSELGAYLAHLSMHRVPLLWCIHRVHHSAETLTVFTRLRDHPLDFLWSALGRAALGSVFAATIMYAAGTPPDRKALMLFLSFSFLLPFVTDAWRHSHLPMSLGPLNRLFNAPIMHQIHHSAETRHFDRNLGAELMIFDWLFGTLYMPDKEESYRWGLNENELGAVNPHNRIRDFYLEPFRRAKVLLTPEPASHGERT